MSSDLDVVALLDLDPESLGPEDLRAALAEVTSLRAKVDAVAAGLVGTLDARGAWAHDGARGTVPWLTARRHGSHRACRVEVDVARVCRRLPAVDAAARAGRLGREKVRGLTWAWQPGLEDALVAASASLVAQVEPLTVVAAWRLVRRWAASARERLGLQDEGTEPAGGTGRSRVTLATALDGRWFGTLDLAPLDGERLASAVEDAVKALWDGGAFHADDGLTAPERRAVGLAEVVRRAVAGGGTSRPGATVLALTDLATILTPRPSSEEEEPGDVVVALAELSRTGPVPTDVLRQLACEADILPVVCGTDGQPLALGRTLRLANRAQRRMLRVRDGHCSFAGCSVPAEMCDAHHLVPWEHGGRTDLGNLVLLCGHHHSLVHQEGFRLERAHDGPVTTYRPDGTPISDTAPDPPLLVRHRAPPRPREPRRPEPTAEELFLHRAARLRIEALIRDARQRRATEPRSATSG